MHTENPHASACARTDEAIPASSSTSSSLYTCRASLRFCPIIPHAIAAGKADETPRPGVDGACCVFRAYAVYAALMLLFFSQCSSGETRL